MNKFASRLLALQALVKKTSVIIATDQIGILYVFEKPLQRHGGELRATKSGK